MGKSLFESFKKYAVDAESMEDFCDRYHHRKAYHERGKEYMACDLVSHKKELEKEGYTMIPQGSSVTGGIVSWYGKKGGAE